MKKKEIGAYIQQNDLKMKVIVSPDKEDDLKKFISDYVIMAFDDSSCLNYSSNDSFKVVSIWTEGVNIILKIYKKNATFINTNFYNNSYFM